MGGSGDGRMKRVLGFSSGQLAVTITFLFFSNYVLHIRPMSQGYILISTVNGVPKVPNFKASYL
jgi:hypothetical protein